MAAGRGHVKLAPQQGLDARGLGLVVEIQHSKEGAVIGDGHCRHLQGRGPGQEVRHPHRAVQQAVRGVYVEVDEF